MTRAHSARWTVLVIVGPLTAVTFAGTTWWAHTHDPRAAASTAAASELAVTASTPEGSLPADEQAQTIQDRIDRVRKQAQKVRRETRRITEQKPSTGSAAVATNSWAPSTPSTGTSMPPKATGPAPSAARPAPAPQVVPAPAPAPPADTTTGAS